MSETARSVDDIRIKHRLGPEPAISVLSRALVNRLGNVVLDVGTVETLAELRALLSPHATSRTDTDSTSLVIDFSAPDLYQRRGQQSQNLPSGNVIANAGATFFGGLTFIRGAANGSRYDYATEDNSVTLTWAGGVWTVTDGVDSSTATSNALTPDAVAANGWSDDFDPTAELTDQSSITFTTSNKAAQRQQVIIIEELDSVEVTLSFPGTWKWVGSIPTSLAADKIGVLSLLCTGTTDADVYAQWAP